MIIAPDGSRLNVACALYDHAVAAREDGDSAAAEGLAREALALMASATGADHAALANVRLTLGDALQDRCSYTIAEREYRHAIAILEAVPYSDEDAARL